MTRTIASCLLIACVGVVLAASDSNRLANPGFEAVEGALPQGWAAAGKDPPPALDRQITHSGSLALRFHGDGQQRSLRQTLTGFASRPFTVAGWVRAENVLIAQGDHATLYVHVIYRGKPYAVATHAYHRIEPGTYDWRRVEVRVDPIASFDIKDVLVTCNAKLSAGTLWFDDLELIESAVWSDLAHAKEHARWLRDSLAAAAQRDAEVSAAIRRVEEAAALLKAAEADVRTVPAAESEQRLQRARALADSALPLLSSEARATFWSATSESPTREIRALYHGGGRTQQEVNARLDRVQTIGANTLYPSLGGWRGVVYASDLAPAHPDWRGSEGFRLLLAEARRRRITVIPYLAIFHADSMDADALRSASPNFLAQRHPADPQRRLAFPAPSHAEAREHAVKMAVELLQSHDPDGLGLDYIRYPSPEALCVCDHCRSEVQARCGFDVRDGNPWTDEAKRAALQAWRREHITATVRAVVAAVRAVKPNALLMAHCLSEPDHAREHYGQDWAAFAAQLDLVTTMNYGAIGGDAGLLAKQAAVLKGKCRFVPAVGGMPADHAACTPREWLRRVALARQHGQGVAIYAIGYLQPDTIELLRNGPFRLAAEWPK